MPKLEELNCLHRSPMNSSTSKALYSFPKDQRFHPMDTGSTCNHFFDKASTISKRSTSFGYGQKSDLCQSKHSPSPDRYKIASEFEKSPKKGKSIGLGRSHCKFNSLFTTTNYPAPGQYKVQDKKSDKYQYSMGIKTKFPQLFADSISPGPAQYHQEKIYNDSGFSFISKYRTDVSHKISEKNEKQNSGETTPRVGPGSYQTSFSSNGKQILAKHKTEKAFVFSKKLRQTVHIDSISPGPGKYDHFSIFGLK